MSDCCSLPTEPTQTTVTTEACCTVSTDRATAAPRGQAAACPRCGAKGKKVDTQTVKALLAVSLRRLHAQEYRFCRTPDCPVVYFAADGSETYTEAELRELVHQKHPDDPEVFVCYCFRYTPGHIRAELTATGRSTVADDIQAGIDAGQCACEIRNPQGSCCLGNVLATVKRAQAELQRQPTR